MRNFYRLLKYFFLILGLMSTSLNAQVMEEQSKLPQIQTEQAYVSCILNGQLGNQLFQIAATLAYAWDYNAIPVFPYLNHSEFLCSYNRDKIFFRLNASESPVQLDNVFGGIVFNNDERVPFAPNRLLWGGFQAWNHFDHHRDRLLEVFAPSQEVVDYLEKKYPVLLHYPRTVAVHVRTFNKALNDMGAFPFLGFDYYKKAMDLFSEDTIFVIFSDRINWCKHHFKKLNRNMVFIEGNDHIQDLFLMSMMKHQIIGNSTYSWWGAYLNKNPDKVVAAPAHWMHPNYYAWPPEESNHFYLPEWKVIKFKLPKKYPEDMTKYDAVSKSIDTQ